MALLVAGAIICVALLYSFLRPEPGAPHGGAFAMIGFVILMPALSGVLVAWLGMRRGERWRWWAQLLPVVIFYIVESLFDSGILDSAWQAALVLGIPWLAAVSYAIVGKNGSKE
jgi:hypothetical protein